MSYSIIETNMPNDQANNEQQPVKKVRDHNPHSMPHRPESKEAISKTQKARWAMLRQIVDKKTISEDRVREIVKETIANFIKNETTPVNNDKPIEIRL